MRKKMTALCLLALLFGCLPALAQEACLTKAEAQAITFSWTDAAGVTHQNNLAETAKDPRHIIALLKEVYTNPAVPGILQSGYKEDGTTREGDVYYGPIGYTPSYNGWGITGTVTKPTNEGYTLMMVAVKDNYKDLTAESKDKSNKELINFIEEHIDSVFVVTDGMRMGEGKKRGTLFSVKGTYNRFFFLSKGKARIQHAADGSVGVKHGAVPFYRMFEEFSPYKNEDTHDNVTDFYNRMIRGGLMPVEHDCNTVFGVNHYFSMSGRQGTDAYDMTGLNLFIPDHRLEFWHKRTINVKYRKNSRNYNLTVPIDARANWKPTVSEMNLTGDQIDEFINNGNRFPNNYLYYYYSFSNYNQNFPVTTFMYAIKLRATLSNTTTVTLNWSSTFNQATGSDMPQDYYLYRVVNGKREASPIATFTDELTWTETVEQREDGYMLSYVVLGKPQAAEYDPIPSNIVSVAIPGNNPEERLKLGITNKNESEFIPNQEINMYANYVVLNNGIGNSITKDMLRAGETKLTLHRIDQGVTEADLADAVVNTITITEVGANSCKWELTRAYQDEANAVASKYGPTSGTFTFDTNGDVKFNNLELCDQFSTSTAHNHHQHDYIYQVNITGLNEFVGTNGTTYDKAHSNISHVYVYKTEHTLLSNTYTQQQVDADITNDGSLAEVKPGVTMEFTTDDDQDVLNYHMYRNATKTGVYGQSTTDGAVVAHNGDGTTVTWAASEGKAQLIDMPTTAGAYTYVPVIETYRDESGARNTYGADRKAAAVARIDANVVEMIMSKDKFEDKGQNNEPCRYYATGLKINPQLPAGVTPRFVRVWHKLPDGYAHEWKAKGSEYAFRLDQTRRCVLYEKDDNDNPDEKGEAIGTPDAPDVPLYMGQSFPMILWDQFGALDIEADGVEPFEVEYVIRVYGTKDGVTTTQGAPRRAAGETEWVIAEKQMTTTYTPTGVVTSVYNVKAEPAVTAVRYVNLAGQVSTRPWMGINVVVTTMADGTTRTTKEVR